MHRDPVLDMVPTTLDEAVAAILTKISDEEKEQIRSGARFDHFGTGRWFRNNWSLWDTDTPLSRWFQTTLGLCHADDLSGCIFAAVWASVRGEEFDPQEHAKRYKEHWARTGHDPMNNLVKKWK